MNLDFGTCAFGYKIKNGGSTPNWATSLGQGKGYKINDNPEIDNILKGLIYSSVPLKNIKTKIGKGGKMVSGDAYNSPIIIGSLFKKVYINQRFIIGGSFILLITKDDSKSHKGRLRLKYGPSNTYCKENVNFDNQDFFNKVKSQLNLAENACWFINEIKVINQDELHLTAIIVNSKQEVEYLDSKELHTAWNNLMPNTDSGIIEQNEGYNKIFYGIPGCGKSYMIDAMLNHKQGFEDEAKRNKILTKADASDVIRTTFYLDYSNSDFIGQIYPCVEKVEEKNNDGSVGYKSIVTYKRIPGPFTKALLQAYQHLIDNDNSQVYLIIEEINRGNAAAIFGDTFQLLDRKNGDSEYPINNEFIESYLRENLENIESLPSAYNLEKIIIPHNLTIFATMNTSDQNVFPLDTAFKRRWNRERVTNNWENVGHIKEMYVPYTSITWENFAKTINKEMISQSIRKDAPISEDKQMGAYFANEGMLTEEPMDKDEIKLNNFENNILDYLYNDVTKFDHSILFKKQLYSIDNIYERINLYIDAINNTGAEPAESKCVFKNVFIDEITEQMLGFVTSADDNND